jgi:biopolymer transport protein ExbD
VSSYSLKKARQKARSHARREPGQMKADINVTPLVDVVLVLLIIFMVVTPMIAGGVPVELPKTANHDRKPDDGKDIIISVTKEKRFYVSGKPVTSAKELTKLVEEEHRKNPEKTAFIKGDNRAAYGAVRDAMEAVSRAGFTDVMLGTDDINDKKGE